jgi:hypothetical protein
MKKHKVKYTDKPIGKIKIVDDFLPKPKDLILKEETIKHAKYLIFRPVRPTCHSLGREA